MLIKLKSNITRPPLRYHAAVKLTISPEIQAALATGQAVVALESTVITHGLPRPQNLELALALEAVVRNAGAVPATIAVLSGDIVVGLNGQQMDLLANTKVDKASLWNLAVLMAKGQSAGTTVSVTLHAASLAGIFVFATGGIGGVHHEPFDESADLAALAKYPVVTVSAGAKSILDVKGTLERLESLGVPVLGYRSDKLAGFHVSQTPYKLPARVETAEEIARAFIVQRKLKLSPGLLISNPVSQGIDPLTLESWLDTAHERVRRHETSGKDVTPFLLSQLADISNNKTVEVNVKLLQENAALAAKVALALAHLRRQAENSSMNSDRTKAGA
jgi:pseudouridylate synthase